MVPLPRWDEVDVEDRYAVFLRRLVSGWLSDAEIFRILDVFEQLTVRLLDIGRSIDGPWAGWADQFTLRPEQRRVFMPLHSRKRRHWTLLHLTLTLRSLESTLLSLPSTILKLPGPLSAASELTRRDDEYNSPRRNRQLRHLSVRLCRAHSGAQARSTGQTLAICILPPSPWPWAATARARAGRHFGIAATSSHTQDIFVVETAY
ncbi:hypothetical protein IWX49DRAFT_324631 [Phyllosticta citricarpa]